MPLPAALIGRYRVIAPTQRGHGLPDNAAATFAPQEDVADAAALLHTAPSLAAALGHSMGGAGAFLLAIRHPDLVPALVVADVTVRNQPPATQPVLDVTAGPAAPRHGRPCDRRPRPS
ncbi:alpha/beta fold hydrolase [Streptomyces sp. NPDC058372]|uniref:alpha/beta fold hydrolase n=1 Tax=Streptomyces sp. NPDC058372 TaxID=3346464 RepID=UPI00365FEDC3